MPMLLTRLEPDHVAGPDLLDGSAIALDQAGAERDDEHLSQRVRVPCRASARLEGAGVTGGARRRFDTEQRIDPHRAGEPIGRPLTRRLRTAALELHVSLL